MNTKILSLMGAALIAVSSMAVQGAEESNWPERQVLFVQPYGPGTALDTATRFLAARLEKEWRQPIVIRSSHT